MKKKLALGYGITAFLILCAAVVWFSLSVTSAAATGSEEAGRTFSWISREAAGAALSDGFMTDAYIGKLTDICSKSRLLSAVVITTPSGSVFAWPGQSSSIAYDMNGRPQIADSSMFMKVFSANLDIGDGASGSVVLTAVLYVLHPDTIFAASRNSFLVILTLLLVTFIFMLADTSDGKRKPSAPETAAGRETGRRGSVRSPHKNVPAVQEEIEVPLDFFESNPVETDDDVYGENEPDPAETSGSDGCADVERSSPNGPEGLFSPVTGIGWEQYLDDRLEAELVRAASSEQDLSLLVIRVAGLVHDDLLSRRIAQVLLDTFKFRDLVFELGENGFAGILQNVNLDQAMRIADGLYADIDAMLLEVGHEGQITVGITTRTARLLPASRMIEEAESAAKKAEEEPSLPIVAFRANPEKYRNYVAGNN